MERNLVSVVMPVHNVARYIDEAMESILNQSFPNFELIIVDDGSTDDTVERIKGYKDSRIRLYRHDHDFIGSLNLGLQEARGKYVARMDADDMMHVDRLRIQYNIMELEPSIDCCGSWFTMYDEATGAKRLVPMVSGKIEYVLLLLLGGNPFCHPTMMLRKDFLDRHHLSYKDYKYAEDYKLWFDVAKYGGVFYIESQDLLCYRRHKGQVTHLKKEEQAETGNMIRDEIIDYLLGFCSSEIRAFYDDLLVLCERSQISHKMKYDFMKSLFTYNKNEICRRINDK